MFEIQTRCPFEEIDFEPDQEIDCLGARELLNALLPVLQMAIAIAFLVVPALRLLKIAVQIARKAKQMHRLEGANVKEVTKALEGSKGSGRTFEGVFEEVKDWVARDIREVHIVP